MLDLLVHNANSPRRPQRPASPSKTARSPASSRGLSPQKAPAREVVDAQGQLVSPPFVDAHFHMIATLSYGLPRVNQKGTCSKASRCGAS